MADVERESAPVRKPTRTDVARLAGVSTAVVSYTVNNGPRRVSEETRRRVEAAVAALDYRPNAAARALKRGRSEFIAVVVPDVASPFFAEMTHRIAGLVRSIGRTLLVVESQPEHLDKVIDDLASRQVDGILSAVPLSKDAIAALGSLDARFAHLDQDGSVIDDVDTFAVDLYRGAREAVQHLIEHGHQEIGYVGPAKGPRIEGWRDVLTDAGLASDHCYLGGFSRVEGYRAGQRLVGQAARPSAVFVSTDEQASGVLRAVHETGLSVPGDVAVVAFDGTFESEFSWPPLTTVRQPLQEIAEAAVGFIETGRGASGARRRFQASLERRASCGCEPLTR